MTDDARFEDAREAPLNLGAFDPDDLKVMSSLVQDAVFPATEMKWIAGQRRFGLLLNRFRWEDDGRGRRDPERVQSLLSFDHVMRVASQGIDRKDPDLVLSLLSMAFSPGDETSDVIELVLAGDGAIRLEVEVLEASLRDVTRPYVAPSRKTPAHPDD